AGEPAPAVVTVPRVSVTVPPPKSVDRPALADAPAVVTVTSMSVTVTPYVTSTPCDALPLVVIVPPVIATTDPAPVANRPFDPVPSLVTEPPLMPIVLPPAASTPASSPYWLLAVVLDELPPVFVIVGDASVSVPAPLTETGD